LAEDAIDRLAAQLKPPRAERWTATAPLPRGDMEGGDFDRFLRTLHGKYPWLDAATVARLARAYGTRVPKATASKSSLSGKFLPYKTY